jgi:hypothetical protein
MWLYEAVRQELLSHDLIDVSVAPDSQRHLFSTWNQALLDLRLPIPSLVP